MDLCRSPMGLTTCAAWPPFPCPPLSSSFQSNSINYNISIGQIFNVMTQKKINTRRLLKQYEIHLDLASKDNGSVSLLASQMVPGVKNLILNLDINLNCKSLSLNYISITSTILIIFNCICLVTKQSGDR